MKTLFYLGNKSHTTQLFTRILQMVILRKLERKAPSSFLLMKNYFKNFMEAYHKINFQVRDGKHDSIIFPDRFSLGSYK